MDESEDNLSADDSKLGQTPTSGKSKPKKRSLVERELETNLTARVTSPVTSGEAGSTSRYGRALRIKTDSDFVGSEKVMLKPIKSQAVEKTPTKVQSLPVYKMHASNSPIKVEASRNTPMKSANVEPNIENQIENIYNENIYLSRFGLTDKNKPPTTKKIYVRKDLIQKREKEETNTLIKNMFSPGSGKKSMNSHLNNILERSSEKYSLNSSSKKVVSSNGHIDTSSVVKILDFDNSKKKKEHGGKVILSKSELFELEAKCEYQVGDLAWARMGTYPFWPCIVTREPASGMFVKKKLFGRIERDIIHVTFFGDNGRRSWIVDTMLRKFLGQLEFEATREHFSPTAKKRDPRLYAAFFVSEKKMPQWSISVEEAETLLREPKRLRIDIFNDMLVNSRSLKSTKPKRGKVTRTDSDVSLSESLYDTLFSENDGKPEDSDGSRNKTRKSLDVSEVVTACLDNMAAKTGMAKIQKQSHMDRWLQKAKSKTPEKSQIKLQVPPKEKERVISSKKKKWEAPKNVPIKKPYGLRKSYESQILMSHHNEHDYSITKAELRGIPSFGIITKVESLKGKEDNNDSLDKTVTNESNGAMCESPTYTQGTGESHAAICESPTYSQDFEDLIFAHEVGTNSYCNLEPNLEKTNDVTIEDTTNNDTRDTTDERIVNEHLCDETATVSLENSDIEKVNETTSADKSMTYESEQASTYLHMNGHTDSIVDSKSNANEFVNDDSLKDFNKEHDVEMKIDDQSPNSTKENEASILNSSINSQFIDHDVSLSTQRIEKTDTETSIENLSQSSTDNNSNRHFVKQVRSKTVKKRSLRLKNRSKAKSLKTQDDKDAFAKYVELRKDAVMDENPELSQDDIMDYLLKTWQYEKGTSVVTQSLVKDKINIVNVELENNNTNNVKTGIKLSVKKLENNTSKLKTDIKLYVEKNQLENSPSNVKTDNESSVEKKKLKNNTSNVKTDLKFSVEKKKMENSTSNVKTDIKLRVEENKLENNTNNVKSDIKKFENNTINTKTDIILSVEKKKLKNNTSNVKGDNKLSGEKFFLENNTSNVKTDINLSVEEKKLKNNTSNVKGDNKLSGEKFFLENNTSNVKTDINLSVEEKKLENNTSNVKSDIKKLDNNISNVKSDIEKLENNTSKVKTDIILSVKKKKLKKNTSNVKHCIKLSGEKQNLENNSSNVKSDVKKLENNTSNITTDIKLGVEKKKLENSTSNVKSDIKQNFEKKICSVSLTDILLQNKIGFTFKVGETTCVLASIGGSNKQVIALENSKARSNNESCYNISSSKSVAHSNNSELCNTEINKVSCDNLDSESCLNITLNNETQSDSNDTGNKNNILAENWDSEMNMSLDNDTDNNTNNAESPKCNSECKNAISENEHHHFIDTNNKINLATSIKPKINEFHSNELELLLNTKERKSEKEKHSSDITHDVEVTVIVESDSPVSDKLLTNDTVPTKFEQFDTKEKQISDNHQLNVLESDPISQLISNEKPDQAEIITDNNSTQHLNDNIEVDSILKSIDDFVNDKESCTELLNSELNKDELIELPQTINGDDASVHINYEADKITDSASSVPEEVSIEKFKCSQNIGNEPKIIANDTSAMEILDNVETTTNVTDTEANPNGLTNEPSESEGKCAQNEPQPKNVNGFLSIDDCTPDISDFEFHFETSSINSEDSEPLSVVKTKLQIKNCQKTKKDMNHPEFLKYVELRQDALMDEHPELNHKEIVEYMYKTWLYEENNKSDFMKTDDIEQSGLVKGVNDDLRQKSIRNSFRANKKRKTKPACEDTLSICSDTSDTSVRRKLRERSVRSPVVATQSKESSPERKLVDEIDDSKSTTSYISKSSTNGSRSNILNEPTNTDVAHKNNIPNSSVKLENEIKVTNNSVSQCGESLKSVNNRSLDKVCNDNEPKKYFDIFKHTEKKNNVIEIKTEWDVKIKEEYDPDTVSINSEDGEVLLSKRKQRKFEKEPSKDDPEFLKYLELRQDALIDEHPELSQDEIVSYLFNTWLYEESVKSDIKKSDEIEQASLVKGLNPGTKKPKKVKKKIKTEKEQTDKDIVQKDKPKRKTSQPYYIEDDLSDSEDIEMFDIFKTKQKHSTGESDEVIDVEEELDAVEMYFLELTKPKPNVFKGLLREKVCEICEKTSTLVKCKGCSGMFHMDCLKKGTEVKVETPTPTRGRKKKKKQGRKSYNFDESESQSDDKSQDVSLENNLAIEEVAEPETYTFDADNFESVLEMKMKELIPTTEANYDNCFTDCTITWNGTIAGKCEIVDVKLQPKIELDYSEFKCSNCQMHDVPVCFVCKLAVSKTGVEYRQRCQTAQCLRYYHMECLNLWPQTQFHGRELSKTGNKNERFEEFMCPRHVCHTCVSDDPRGCKTRFSGDKLARCVRCPATYHTFTKCLPAGSQILTGSHIVCPRHYEHGPGKVPCHVNTGWCFICALGGSLICCEYCPTSFHAECLNIKPPEGGYMCEDCETGRLPLYGEMVWVKLGHYRWWPGLILHPTEIPDNIMAIKHSLGEFVVRFFGQYDHYWVNRGRVFPFQEGDSGKISGTKSKIDAAFTTAMEHAQRACEVMKRAVINEEEETDIASSLLPPHYVKLKVNKPVGSVCARRNDEEESSLTQCDCDPRDTDPCGPYTHCLNRMLLTECGPSCRAGDRCNNRAFEKRLYPRMAPYKTPHRGWGLRTLEDIKAGQFVIEYVGELIDEEEFRRRMQRKHEIRDENFYFLTLDKERMIDAGPKGNLARFMNHCCEPNCETQKWTVLGDVRVGLFAIYDIPAKSELTFNYNLECAGIEKKRCLCGAKRCSGYMGAKPKQDEQPKKTKRVYKKRKGAEESPSTSKNKPKKPVGRPAKPKELTEIEKDLLIIKNATNGISSDSECSGRLSSIDLENAKAMKRKRVDFSTEDSCSSPIVKKTKVDDEKPLEVGD